MESSFTTFFRLSKHEKFTEFTRLDSLNLIRQDMELSFMTFFRLSKHEKFTKFAHLDSLNLIRWGTELSFLTFFRLSKHEKFTEFTRLDSLNLIRWGKSWKKWILPLLHLRKVDLAAKFLNMALPRKLFRNYPNPTIYEY